MFRTTFIGITGSVGKTTAKECLAAILSSQAPTVKTTGSLGARYELPRTILRTRPWHRFTVAEIGIVEPGVMWRSALLFKPDIAVVLNADRTHTTSFKDLDVTAREKGRLVKGLSRKGTAVLNFEDPRVRAMAPARKKTCFFGGSSEADVWGDGASSCWPDRLSFRAHAGGETATVKMRLVGTHWMNSVLAAIAAAHCCGVNLADAARALKGVAPFTSRMQPVALPCGAVMLRDEHNGAAVTFEQAVKVLREAKVERRILAASECSDYGRNYPDRLRFIARLAAESCDLLVLIGSKSAYGARRAVEAGMSPEAVKHFKFPKQAAEFLKTELHRGDLILLKGRHTDHLARIYFALRGPVDCWRTDCRLVRPCDHCPELGAQYVALE